MLASKMVLHMKTLAQQHLSLAEIKHLRMPVVSS